MWLLASKVTLSLKCILNKSVFEFQKWQMGIKYVSELQKRFLKFKGVFSVNVQGEEINKFKIK